MMNLERMFPTGKWDDTGRKFLVMKGRYFWPAAMKDGDDIVLTDFGKRMARPVEEGVTPPDENEFVVPFDLRPLDVARPVIHLPTKRPRKNSHDSST